MMQNSCEVLAAKYSIIHDRHATFLKVKYVQMEAVRVVGVHNIILKHAWTAHQKGMSSSQLGSFPRPAFASCGCTQGGVSRLSSHSAASPSLALKSGALGQHACLCQMLPPRLARCGLDGLCGPTTTSSFQALFYYGMSTHAMHIMSAMAGYNWQHLGLRLLVRLS